MGMWARPKVLQAAASLVPGVSAGPPRVEGSATDPAYPSRVKVPTLVLTIVVVLLTANFGRGPSVRTSRPGPLFLPPRPGPEGKSNVLEVGTLRPEGSENVQSRDDRR